MAISLLLPVVSTIQPNLFEMRHEDRAADARLEVLLGEARAPCPANGSASISRNAACAGSIGTVSVRMPRFGERLGVGDAALARVARRHEHAGDVLGAERVDRDRGDERRVDAAREPDEHVGEAVLA